LLYQAWERQRCVESEKGMMEQKRLGNTEPNAVVELVKTLNNFNWKQAFIWSLENNNFVFLQSAVAEFAKKFKLYAFQEKIEFNAYIFHHEKLQIKQNNIQVLWLHISGIADLDNLYVSWQDLKSFQNVFVVITCGENFHSDTLPNFP